MTIENSLEIAQLIGISLADLPGIPILIVPETIYPPVWLIWCLPPDVLPEGALPFQFFIQDDGYFHHSFFPKNTTFTEECRIAAYDAITAPYYMLEGIYAGSEITDRGIDFQKDVAGFIFVIFILDLWLNPYWVITDAPFSGQFGFQDPATAVMEAIINFHHDLFFFLVMIVTFVSYLLARCIILFNEEVHDTPDDFVHGTVIEIVWTITPALILVVIAIPSFSLLYSMDEVISPNITVKAIGHQWYWSYEYSDFVLDNDSDITYDSYMVPGDLWDNPQKQYGFRLLEAQYYMLLPYKAHVRLITTSADVIHSWAVPSFGVKLDACPGRLNQTSIYIKRTGRFFGQCSEICGVNHGFMPIAVVVAPQKVFIDAMCCLAESQGTAINVPDNYKPGDTILHYAQYKFPKE